mgnify:CR=1 FL=1
MYSTAIYQILAATTSVYHGCKKLTHWHYGTVKVMYKGRGNMNDPSKYRGIALENAPFKILTKIITDKIKRTIGEQLPDAQFGFRPGRSTIMAVALLQQQIEEALERDSRFYTIFVDFTKAFDLMNRKMIMEKLESSLGKENTWTRIISSIMENNTIVISDGLQQSKPIVQTNGVLQGDPLSLLLFILTAEEMVRKMEEVGEAVHVYAYADDVALGSTNLSKLQNAIIEMEEWCNNHSFHINTSKTEMMVFRKGVRYPTRQK